MSEAGGAFLRHALRGFLFVVVAASIVLFGPSAHAQGLKPIDLGVDLEKVDVASLGQMIAARGDSLQVETAVAADGTSGRMAVRAATPGTSPNWFVFAVRNATDRAVERWLIAERFSHVGSGIVWPSLDARRLEAVTPSLGVVPERLPIENSDAFRLMIEPGQTVTFVVELAGDRLARMQLWRGTDFDKRLRNRQMFHGILLGVTGLIALFLSTIFAANHKVIFPAAAFFTWSVLAYLLVDFGFWHKLFAIKPDETGQYRAATEAVMVASLLVFAHTFLRLGRTHALIRMVIGLAMIGTFALVGLAFLDPRLAATFARLGLVGVLGFSAFVTLFLALRGQDRALAIIPTWVLFGVWTFAAGLIYAGRLQSDVVVNGVTAGLVIIVMIIAFTVTQFAFRQLEPMLGVSQDEQTLRALAIDGTGAAVFEWNAKREDVRVGAALAAGLGQKPLEIREPLSRFVDRLHPADRDRLLQLLGGLKDQGKGLIQQAFRAKHVDGTWRWFELEGAGVATGERRMARCIGLVRDVTDARRTQANLLEDAVYDKLTRLPNRALLIDRLTVAIARAKQEPLVQPTAIYIDLDRFKAVNETYGTAVGDSLLITIARRLAQMVGPGDTVARVGGDQFLVVFTQARAAGDIARLADDVRNAVKGVVAIAGQEAVLACSIGVATYDAQATVSADDLVADAEVAMYRARRGGVDRIEVFSASMRGDRDDRHVIEQELRAAIDRRELKIRFQPIMRLRTEELAGFEAQVRWEHPRFGVLDPAAFVPGGEQSDLMIRLGMSVIEQAMAEAVKWNKEFERPSAPIFVSVNVSSRQLLRPELVAALRQLQAASKLPRDILRLEITEMVLLEQPEQATVLVADLAAVGVKLSLDDFGAGYSSLSYLTRFPFDTIKVDQALVHAAAVSAENTAVLRSIVALSHELGKTVVAEGVDTEEDAALMRLVGGDLAQGTFYGEPKTAREAMAFVKDLRWADKRRRGGGLFRLKSRRIDDVAPPAAVATEVATARSSKRRVVARGKTAGVPVGPQPIAPQQVQAAAVAATRVPEPIKIPPMPPPAVEPLPIDRSLSRLKAEIAQVQSTARAADLAPQLEAVRSPGVLVGAGGSSARALPPPLPSMAPAAEPPTVPSGRLSPPPAVAPAPRVRPPIAAPDLSSLPPAIAASLAKLAGAKVPATDDAKTGTD
jgi:diguanylate cyclase (GGDEF)-like protein/PAS domain S-box-containing protein